VKTRTIALLACLAGLFAMLAPATASAGWDFKAPANGISYGVTPGTLTSVASYSAKSGWDYGVDTTDSLNPTYAWHLASPYSCMNDHTGGGSAWPLGTVAAEWSRMAAELNFAFDYELADGCNGWTEGETIDVYYYNGGSTPDTCGYRKNTWNSTTGAQSNANMWINLQASALCRSTVTRRANTASRLSGELIGLQLHHNGNRSVMSDTDWTHDNIGTAQLSDGQTIDAHYPF
jgi:hypothetical protein